MLKVNDKEIEFTIDTGAEVSMLNTNVAKNLGLNIIKPAKVLSGADGSKLNVRGMADVCIASAFRSLNTNDYIIAGSSKNLLGLPDIQRLNLLDIVNSLCSTKSASKKFRDCFKCIGFSLVTSSPRYPESNGLAESAVRTVKRLRQKGTDKTSILLAYRSTPLSSGYSPIELMFGRSIRSNLGLPFVDQIDYGDYDRKEIDRVRNRADIWNKNIELRNYLTYSLMI